MNNSDLMTQAADPGRQPSGESDPCAAVATRDEPEPPRQALPDIPAEHTPDTPALEQPPATPPVPEPPAAELTSTPEQPSATPSAPEPPAAELISTPEQPPSPAPQPQPTSAQWKYNPVPKDLPEPYAEYISRSFETPDGWKVIGARVRGKQHKQDGTNCDDWFECTVSEPWLLVAVSDGAGSRRFSRVGAKTSCQAAVKTLSKALRDVQLQPRPWMQSFAMAESGEFIEPDLQKVASALHSAMQAALQAVQHKAKRRSNSLEHYEALGKRRIEGNDLLATLMLAVQTRVLGTDGAAYDLIISCSVGDGMIAAIDKNGKARLLLNPDTGQYSGETEFLSEKALAQSAFFKKRLKVIFGSPQRTLLAMTDGVADDYFPNHTGMSRLYADLVLNGIIRLQDLAQEEIESALRDTQLPNLEAVKQADFTARGETLTEQGIQPIALNSSALYAKLLGIELEQVVASPALLLAGYQAKPVLAQVRDPAERLQLWLDSYQVRGSFDDRTLVVAYREQL